MAGKIKRMIDTIIQQKAQGNKVLASNVRIKLILKGIFPEKYDESSADDENLISKIQQVATEFGLKV